MFLLRKPSARLAVPVILSVCIPRQASGDIKIGQQRYQLPQSSGPVHVSNIEYS